MSNEVYVGVNLHVHGTQNFRMDKFDSFISVKLVHGVDGVNVFISQAEHARTIAELFTAAAVALDEKRVAEVTRG